MIGKPYFAAQRRAADAAEENRAARVLVVDDVPDILDYFLGVFRRVRGMDVKLVVEANAATALERVKVEEFDVVITDFRMKDVNGISILREARKRNPDGIRVLMTGYNEIPAKVEDIREAEVDAYVQKPLAAQDLLILVHDILGRNPKALAELRTHARELEDLAAGEERRRLSGPLG